MPQCYVLLRCKCIATNLAQKKQNNWDFTLIPFAFNFIISVVTMVTTTTPTCADPDYRARAHITQHQTFLLWHIKCFAFNHKTKQTFLLIPISIYLYTYILIQYTTLHHYSTTKLFIWLWRTEIPRFFSYSHYNLIPYDHFCIPSISCRTDRFRLHPLQPRCNVNARKIQEDA